MAESATPATLKFIGYWINSSEMELFAPQEFVTDIPAKERNAILDYLQNGQLFETYRGLSWCRFLCPQHTGHREYTDGYWVWPEGLSHYVAEHGVVPPDEFRKHVRSKPKPRPWNKGKRDTSWWASWCKSHQRGWLQEELAKELAMARRNINAVNARKTSALQKAIRKLEATKGCSEAKCVWSKCNRHALAGSAFCAHCQLKEQYHPAAPEHLIDLTRILEHLNERLATQHRPPAPC